MNRNLRFSTLALAAAAMLTLGACSKTDDRTAGEKLDSTVAKTEQRAAEAKSDVSQGMANAKTEAQQAADRAAAAVDKGTDKAAAAIDNATGKAGQALSDAGITTSINAELAKDSTLSALKINVDTADGKVVLRGSAPSTDARERATRLAQAVKGVTGVDNRLEVRG